MTCDDTGRGLTGTLMGAPVWDCASEGSRAPGPMTQPAALVTAVGFEPVAVATADATVDTAVLVAAATEAARAAVVQGLDAEGFQDAERASAILRGLTFGSDYGDTTPDARDILFRISGRLISACTRTGDPDAAVRGIEALALAAPNPAATSRSST